MFPLKRERRGHFLSILFALFTISVVFNVLAIYLHKNWKFNFTEKLNENNFFEDEHVNVEVQRAYNKIHVSVESTNKELFFNVSHDLKPLEEKSHESKIPKGKKRKK